MTRAPIINQTAKKQKQTNALPQEFKTKTNNMPKKYGGS